MVGQCGLGPVKPGLVLISRIQVKFGSTKNYPAELHPYIQNFKAVIWRCARQDGYDDDDLFTNLKKISDVDNKCIEDGLYSDPFPKKLDLETWDAILE